MILLIILFFFFIIAGIIRKKRPHFPSDSYWKLSRNARQSFVASLILIVVGGAIYIFWPSVYDAISNKIEESLNTKIPGNAPVNRNLDFGAMDVSNLISQIVVLIILGIICYVIWENRRRLIAYFWITWDYINGHHYFWVRELSWEPKAKKNVQFSLVWNAIKEFPPTRYYNNERDYQRDLYHWLKNRFPDIQWEPATGGIRADLSIGKIAIELKADANNGTLDSLAFKVLANPNYYERLYIVIFGHHFRRRRFREFEKGTKSRHPEVGLITKPKYVSLSY